MLQAGRFALKPERAYGPLKLCTKGIAFCTHVGANVHVINCKMQRCVFEGTGRASFTVKGTVRAPDTYAGNSMHHCKWIGIKKTDLA